MHKHWHKPLARVMPSNPQGSHIEQKDPPEMQQEKSSVVASKKLHLLVPMQHARSLCSVHWKIWHSPPSFMHKQASTNLQAKKSFAPLKEREQQKQEVFNPNSLYGSNSGSNWNAAISASKASFSSAICSFSS